MPALRLISSYLLAAWLGAALLVAAVVAPAAFAVLPTRTLAGALVGRVLPALFVSGIVVGLLTVLSARIGAGGPDPGRFPVARTVLGALIVAACVAAQLVIAPRIAAVRARIGPSVEALPPGDERRAAFGRLHGLSVAALGVAMLAGGAALVLGAIPGRGGRAVAPAPSSRR